MCGFPKLIAACHVLHRLYLPRHPPCALSSLTIEFTRTQQSNNLYHLPVSILSIRLYQFIDTNYLKTLNNCSAHRSDTTRRWLAQPCSYIYPIYSVVKNHQATCCRCRTLRRLEHFCSRFKSRQSRIST